ncbi:MAG: adenylate kinase [Bacteroidetes bacterium CG2_30_33_31]|nr:MAG: adenylate kinase [Bacteroidetes bacterium CG2_30_33_31]
MLNIAIFGPPGAGKGTQSKFLMEKYNLTYISTGDILRVEIAENSVLGQKAKDVIAAGKLVSDDLIVQIIEKRIISEKKDGILFDGFPRTVVQAYILDGLLIKLNTSLSFMLSLEVPREELISRLVDRGKVSGRSDDNEEVILNRLQEYEDKTLPLKEFYKERGKFIAIDGVGDISDITKRLSNAIDKTLKRTYFNIVVTGKPGSGRGTQAKMLADKYNLAYISTGKLMRQEIQEGTALGKICLGYMDNGDLVPDEYPIRLIERVIRENPHVNGYVFKGFPRTLVQAYILDGLLKKIHSKLDIAIEMDTKTLVAIKRLSERSKTNKARSYDMSTEVIIHRLEEWQQTIKRDVSTFYSDQNKLVRIDGTGEDDAVFKVVDAEVSKLINI